MTRIQYLMNIFGMTLLVISIPCAEVKSQEAAFRNERWEMQGDIAVIRYDLMGDPGMEVTIAITLRREGDKAFSFVPRSATGNVGEGQTPGSGKEIRWDYKKDIRQELLGSDYKFELVGTIGVGGIPWWVYAAGGGAAAILVVALTGKSGGDDGGGNTGLPDPPGIRP